MAEYRIAGRYKHLRNKAERSGDNWELTEDEFAEWFVKNHPDDNVCQHRMTVTVIDDELPWRIGNLQFVPAYTLYMRSDPKVKQLTVSQWLNELKKDQTSKMA